ncbi:hypothetical protein [Mesorhizobium sp. ES1-1]|uniref:hypothetical protein n=1 Tax=Mesorhizobium sp. ES1-1 TaxID=2876629 RepID=UPI001CCFBF8E|nr:hypothetical protein [Mesorhizobium sp. ES1-1]MBZ9678900.1 hypothetical protein [Mesorhizobium sp. ES1-1]
MKYLRPLLLACMAVAVAFVPLVGLAPIGDLFHPPASFAEAGPVFALRAAVTTDVMTLWAIALIAIALIVVAYALGLSGRTASRKVARSDFWRLSEPYRRTPG